jgi:mevalonate kinase
MITSNDSGLPDDVAIDAPNIRLNQKLKNLPERHPFTVLVHQFKRLYWAEPLPPINIKITSTIPIAAGLGSGAAISISIIRALAKYLDITITDSEVNDLAYLTEKIYHGSPSGIDNTVIAFNQPIFFVREQPFVPLKVNDPFILIIGDSGHNSKTIDVVSGVRNRWRNDQGHYNKLFAQIGNLCQDARSVVESGESHDLGVLMKENHRLLQKIGVSTKVLNQLVETAIAAGALGAKLSGSGGGGNMIALVETGYAQAVESALIHAGATRIIITNVTAEKTKTGS